MDLTKIVYSVLIVSSSNNFNQNINEMFPSEDFSPINIVNNISAAKRALTEREFDFIIVNSPLIDDSGIRFSIDISDKTRSLVLFLVRNDLYDDIYDRLVPYGIFILQKPISKNLFQTSLSWLISAREKIRKNEKKTLSFEEKMNEIRLVNRAKWLLISELKMSEPDAHRYIEKQAMDRCEPKRKIAEEIINTYGTI